MGLVSLMIFKDEIVVFELAAVPRLDLPVQECAKRVALHEAVEETANLVRPPYKLALNSR